MLGSKNISAIKLSAPFKMLNVDMDKDPIETAEDLFAHIFKVAEKGKTDHHYIYCFKNTIKHYLSFSLSSLWVSIRNIKFSEGAC